MNDDDDDEKGNRKKTYIPYDNGMFGTSVIQERMNE